MARRKKSKTDAPYLSQPAMQKMAEGLFELVMGMVAGKEITTDNNKEKHGKLNNCAHTDTDKSV
tara:strand:+ start:217 stop:408 length:192 start_codon:yes stop_codon:yes gene_type:complete